MKKLTIKEAKEIIHTCTYADCPACKYWYERYDEYASPCIYQRPSDQIPNGICRTSPSSYVDDPELYCLHMKIVRLYSKLRKI